MGSSVVVVVESTVEAGVVVDGAVVPELHAAATRESAARGREIRDMEEENTDESPLPVAGRGTGRVVPTERTTTKSADQSRATQQTSW